MRAKTPQYLMHKLMNYSEIDAFSAQKKAGSNSAYFDLLEKFTATAPGLVVNLTLPTNAKELAAFQRDIHTLQKHLFAIGSSTLLWLAQKADTSARCGCIVKCENEIFQLASRINTLCAQLDEAKVDTTAAERATIALGAANVSGKQPTLGGAKRPKAPIKPEHFEKLCILIDNFERDDALFILHSLMEFSYDPVIDAVLAAINNGMLNFDYDESAHLAKRLLSNITQMCTPCEKTGAKKKILAIDDVPDVLNTVKSALRDDYAVYGVTNHMAALKFLTGNTADLILLDIEMPDMSGFVLLDIIRKIKAYEATPVLFLTGSLSVENIEKAHSVGGSDFIKKPVDAKVLLEKVGKHLP